MNNGKHIILKSTNNIAKHIIQLCSNPRKHSTPVFLIGCGRSGTNLMVRQLNRLWQVQLYNEKNPAAFDNWRLRDLVVIDELIKRSYAPIVLFKPINDTYRATTLLETFTNSKVIFQFRHFGDVVNSIIRGPFGSRKGLVRTWINTDFQEFHLYPPSEETKELIRSLYNDKLSDESASALYWLLQNRFFVDRHLKKSSRVRLLQYENLVKEPQQTLKQICKFVNIKDKPKLFQDIRSSSIGKDKMPDLAPSILNACESLWLHLSNTAAIQHKF